MSNDLNINWNSASQLLPVFAEFYQMKKADQEIDLVEAAGKLAGAVGVTDPESFLAEAVQKQLDSALNEDGANELAAVVAAMGEPILQLAGEFTKGKMKPRALLDGLNDIYLKSLDGLEGTLEKAVGFKIPAGAKAILKKYELATISIYCFAAAYKIYRKASDDAALAREHRMEIERLCEESISGLKKQRREMESLVSKYMLDRLEPFVRGVNAMDDALLANDDDGYIGANAEIWAALGHETQYKNANEFNDLMMSDDTFKL